MIGTQNVITIYHRRHQLEEMNVPCMLIMFGGSVDVHCFLENRVSTPALLKAPE
jgi:hypothetical protein